MQLLKLLNKSEVNITVFEDRIQVTEFFTFRDKLYLACVERKGDIFLRVFEYLERQEQDVLKLKFAERINF